MSTKHLLCPDPQTLRRYLLDALPEVSADAVDAHLGNCTECQATIEELIGVETVLPSGNVIDAADDTPPALPEFQVRERIAGGGMGILWRVHDQRLGRELAMKVVRTSLKHSPTATRRFIQESHVCGRLAHPFIVPVHHAGTLADGRPYYTMKYIEGETFAEILNSRADFRDQKPEILRIFLHLCEAVAFAHAKGVIHRDLKPQNVMVGQHDEVQLMDWGLAKKLAGQVFAEDETVALNSLSTTAEDEDDGRTQFGDVMGTYAYMSPEQAAGDRTNIDRRTDVFALGSILCEILTGEPAYCGPSQDEVKRQSKNADVADAMSRLLACQADPELVDLAQRCLSVSGVDRLQDAQHVADSVKSYLVSAERRLQQLRIEHAQQCVQRAERNKRNRLALSFGSFLAIALLLGCTLFAHREHQRAQLPLTAKGHLYDADAAFTEKDIAEVQRHYRQAVADMKHVIQLAPKQMEYRFHLARIYSKWGDDLAKLGQPARSVIPLQQSIETRKELVRLARTRDHQLGLAHATAIYGAVRVRLNRPEAETSLELAEHVLRDLSNQLTREEIAPHQAIVRYRWANALRSAGRDSEANELNRKADELQVDIGKVEHLQLGVPGWRQVDEYRGKKRPPKTRGQGNGRGGGKSRANQAQSF